MDFESNCADADDELQMFENTSETKSVTATNVSVSCGTNDRTKSVGASGKIISSDVGKEVVLKKVRGNTSEVWNNYEKIGVVDGVEKCKCKGCGRLYTCNSDNETTHLRRHVQKCHLIPKYNDVGDMLVDHSGTLRSQKLDHKAYRDALSRCIIMHDLPFSYAEYEGVWVVNRVLNPDFKPISRNTAKADCWNDFLIEKTKLKSILANIPSRICLTSDVWTTVTTQGYMTVIAHYVDKWKLNSKLLAFCELESPHTGIELYGKVFGVLKDWGIDGKIFSLTLDNASSNDSMQNILKERLNLKNGLLFDGDFFHVRCCAHILNLIVQEGLKVAKKALYKIRESVKYVKASEGRLKQFHKCVEEVHLDGIGSFLRLDVSTRCNATYMMLESSIKYRRAFNSLTFNDRSYTLCPSNEEWEKAEKMCAFLAPFYHITNLISGSSYPTSNLYFLQVYSIERKLNESLYSECHTPIPIRMADSNRVRGARLYTGTH